MEYLLYHLHYMIGLNILHYSKRPRCDARVDKRFEGYHVLQMISAGAIDISYDARRYRLEGCWFFPSYPGPHTIFHCAPGHEYWHHRYIAFTGPQVQHWIAEGLIFHEPQPGDASVHEAMFDEVLAAAEARGRWTNARTVNLLERLFIDLAERRAMQEKQDEWLDRVLLELDFSVSFEIDYRKLAKRMGIGVSTLRRDFQRVTGISIHNYVIDSRVTRARELLRQSDLPVGQIAEELGYKDIYFFSRQFKQRVGMSPSAYRNSL